MVDFIKRNKMTKQWTVIAKATVTSGAVDVIIPVDPERIIQVTVHAGSNTWTLQTASVENDTGDIENVSQLWLTRVDDSTSDFGSGNVSNKGFLGIRFIVTSVTGTFTYQVAKNTQSDQE